MKRKELGCWVAVFSTKRPKNVERMQALIGPATWYVGDGEEAAYRLAGASKVVASGGLCESRNAALQDAWKRKLPALIVSDDMTRCAEAFVDDQGKKKARPIGIVDVVDAMKEAMFETGAKLAGVAPTANPFYWTPGRDVKAHAFIVGDLNLVKPCDLLFDEDLRLKEDYDYTLQHLDRYGVVARCDNMLVTFVHRSNPGGAVDVRTPALEQATIAQLREKWGDAIRDNTRRPNEILLNLKRWKPKKSTL